MGLLSKSDILTAPFKKISYVKGSEITSIASLVNNELAPKIIGELLISG